MNEMVFGKKAKKEEDIRESSDYMKHMRECEDLEYEGYD